MNSVWMILSFFVGGFVIILLCMLILGSTIAIFMPLFKWLEGDNKEKTLVNHYSDMGRHVINRMKKII